MSELSLERIVLVVLVSILASIISLTIIFAAKEADSSCTCIRRQCHQVLIPIPKGDDTMILIPTQQCTCIKKKCRSEKEYKAVRLKKYRWNGMLQEPGRRKEYRYHPTQKPTEIMSWAILQAVDYAEKKKKPIKTILDPFMGSGTTLYAAKNMSQGLDKMFRMWILV